MIRLSALIQDFSDAKSTLIGDTTVICGGTNILFIFQLSKLINSDLEFQLRVRFFKKIQDWILKSEIIRKRILRFFTQQINPRSLGSRCLKGDEESTPRVDSSVPLIHHDPRDLGLICLVKKRKIRFRILSDIKNPILDFFKETHP